MNFLKGSLFRRNTEPEELEPMEESGGGILAVWGSPGCGKTVTAVKIAKHLATQKKNTVLLLCDMTAPMMPCICPPSELEVDKSLGSIFAAQHISVNLIKHNLTTLKRLPHLTMLGLRKKENEYTYAPCTKQQAEELIRGLREIVPYVVIDCSSYIANDILSAVALMEADSVLQLASCASGRTEMGQRQAIPGSIQHQALSGGRPHRSGAGQRSLPAAVFAGVGGAVSGR